MPLCICIIARQSYKPATVEIYKYGCKNNPCYSRVPCKLQVNQQIVIKTVYIGHNYKWYGMCVIDTVFLRTQAETISKRDPYFVLRDNLEQLVKF